MILDYLHFAFCSLVGSKRHAKIPRRCPTFVPFSPICRTIRGQVASLELQVYISKGVGKRSPHILQKSFWIRVLGPPHDSRPFALCSSQSTSAYENHEIEVKSIGQLKEKPQPRLILTCYKGPIFMAEGPHSAKPFLDSWKALKTGIWECTATMEV